ncbi:MAG: HEAT repeat domain-containing protein [Candidatus Methanomethylophilaceae archaeon]
MSDDPIDLLSGVESDLRAGKDCTDALDEIFQISFTEGEDVLEKASWCLAKMAQNKCQDMRVYDILMSMSADACDPVAENIAWGLGEMAGSGIGSGEALDLLKRLTRSETSTVRSTAAWAIGRYHHRLRLSDPESVICLESLLDDGSKLVRRSARFAIDDE